MARPPEPVPSLPAALPGERREIDSAAGRISYYAANEASTATATATPLLLVHSVNAAASAYEVKPLYEHYMTRRPVYALDLPGYGFSERSERRYTPRLMTDAVLALVDEIGRRHGDGDSGRGGGGVAVDGIAASLGCEFLARAAVERPAAFRSVGLVSATGLNCTRPLEGAPGSDRGAPWLFAAFARAPWSAALFRLLTRPGVIRFFLEKTWGSSAIDEGLLAYDVITTRQPGASRAPFYFVSAFLFSADISRVYEQLGVPVWLVHGTRGDFVDYRDAPRLARRAGWTVDAMATGALPYFEDLPAFIAAHEAFIGRVVATAMPRRLGTA